jgi:hypothetical protein
MFPLKKAPSPIVMRCAITFPIKELALRMSTRSLASMLPRTLPRTTTSRAEIFAATCASRVTVTRPPGRLIAPSTFPSMYNHSEDITSPLISRLLAIVAGPPAVGSVGGVREGLTVDASRLAASEGGRSFFCSPIVVNGFVLNQHVLLANIYRHMRPITYCFSLTCRIPFGSHATAQRLRIGRLDLAHCDTCSVRHLERPARVVADHLGRSPWCAPRRLTNPRLVPTAVIESPMKTTLG